MAPMVSRPYLIGVTGASGSGKTTLAGALLAHFQQHSGVPSVACISLDSYYRDLGHLSFAERDQLNFDHPDAIEFELLNRQLEALDKGLPITIPDYDFSQHTRRPGGTLLQPPQILILEGLLLAANQPLLQRLDHLVFVETDLALCLMRRISRDVAERGRSERSVRSFWAERVAPMYEQFGAPAAPLADTRVSGELASEDMVAEIAGAIPEWL